MISSGEASGQGRETYGISPPVNKRGQSKSAVVSLAEANENMNTYSEGTRLKRRPGYVDHIRGVRRESSVTCLMDQEGMKFVARKKNRLRPERG